MIEAYWSEVFGQFREENGKFNILGFPEPLMSPHFGVKNIIGPTTDDILQTFKLCIFEPLTMQVQEAVHQQSLSEAVSGSEFWDFQLKNNESYGFMQRLLPFLLSLPHPHYHFYIKENEEIKASALVGVAECGCFLFNLSVHPDARTRGLAKLLFNQIRASFFEKKTFYWTIHPWFTFDSVAWDYHILK